MADREKLIELLEEVPHPQRLYPDLYVDRLIANGVTVRERGRWVLKETCGQNTEKWHCSVCDGTPKSLVTEDFCPNCGTDMRGEEE